MQALDVRPRIVKVGGSLYDVPDLGSRLQRWLSRLGSSKVLLVPGGGVTADAVRMLDHWQRLGDETAHWLALQGLSLNARFLARLVPGSEVVSSPTVFFKQWHIRQILVLDAYAFAQQDEDQPGALPHTWAVTSDSIAARVAEVCGASPLFLLKSVPLPSGTEWTEAGRRGLVDPYFAQVVSRAALEVHWVDMRNGQP